MERRRWRGRWRKGGGRRSGWRWWWWSLKQCIALLRIVTVWGFFGVYGRCFNRKHEWIRRCVVTDKEFELYFLRNVCLRLSTIMLLRLKQGRKRHSSTSMLVSLMKFETCKKPIHHL
ncbi:hypothetical protein GW17_00059768 [Ensete ventricosum]|nr:hypothetical protein GW17_00059768 [Ensete ventricosum]